MKRHAPATQRNRDPILAVLKRVLPGQGMVLEIAAGTGEHGACFAPHFPYLIWQCSDADGDALASIAAWQRDGNAPNLRPPLKLDVLEEWPVRRAEAVFCANMIHISPWECGRALLTQGGNILPPGGVMVLYGPYKVEGRHTAPSNEAFDADLRSRNPQWGVRDLETVIATAAKAGLAHRETVPMPANNFCVVLEKGQKA